MHDVVIVGGRCAGAPLALLLARAGHRVLVVDRARFPSDTMSTHFVQSPGMARLANWGLIDDVFATNCPPITRSRFSIDGEVLEFDLPAHPGIPGLASPRRYLLDKLLVDAAEAAGAEFATGVSVDGLLRDGDRVVGIAGHTSDGGFEARGRFVVGADGRHSLVARETEAPFRVFEKSRSAGYYSYFRGLDCRGAELYLHEGLFCVMFPTNDGLTTIAVGWPQERFAEIRSDIDGNFRAALERLGVGERMANAERAERYVGTAEVPNYLRTAWGPGWALIGDALYYKDPAPADGISDAFRAAEYLAESLHGILEEGEDESAALTRFEERNDAYALPLLDAAVRTASFDLTSQERADAFIGIRMNNAEEVSLLRVQDALA